MQTWYTIAGGGKTDSRWVEYVCARVCVCVQDGQSGVLLSTADGFFLLQYVNYQDTNWDVSDGKKQAGDTTEDKSDNVALFTSANVELTPVQVTGTDGKYAAVAGWSGAAYQQIKMDGRSFYRSKGRQLARWSVSRAKKEMEIIANKYTSHAQDDANLCTCYGFGV